MKTNTLTPELLHKMDAYWRAANYLSVGQIYLYDNPLLLSHLDCRRAQLPEVPFEALDQSYDDYIGRECSGML